GDELAAAEFFRGAALIDIHVRGIAADHGMKRPRDCRQAQGVGGRAVENHESPSAGAKMFLQRVLGRLRVPVAAVAGCMAQVDSGNRLQNFRMDTSIVVAGKTADRFHATTNVAEQGFGLVTEALQKIYGWVSVMARPVVSRMSFCRAPSGGL